jgi:undecaprenyl-diphosphatase
VAWPGYPPQDRLIPVAVVAGVAALAGKREAAWQAGALGVVPLGEVAKKAVGRPRPPTAWIRVGRRRPKGSSFPSTHVADYTAFYGHLAAVIVRSGGQWRWLAGLPLGLVVLIGPSRNSEGDHWRTDVLAGYALGGTYLGGLLFARRLQGLGHRRWQR